MLLSLSILTTGGAVNFNNACSAYLLTFRIQWKHGCPCRAMKKAKSMNKMNRYDILTPRIENSAWSFLNYSASIKN